MHRRSQSLRLGDLCRRRKSARKSPPKRHLDHVGDKALAKGDHAEMCACCADVVHEIEAANAEMSKLQKLLKIENPTLPKR
jgi:hypothetical protein